MTFGKRAVYVVTEERQVAARESSSCEALEGRGRLSALGVHGRLRRTRRRLGFESGGGRGLLRELGFAVSQRVAEDPQRTRRISEEVNSRQSITPGNLILFSEGFNSTFVEEVGPVLFRRLLVTCTGDDVRRIDETTRSRPCWVAWRPGTLSSQFVAILKQFQVWLVSYRALGLVNAQTSGSEKLGAVKAPFIDQNDGSDLHEE